MIPQKNLIFYKDATSVSEPLIEYHNATSDEISISVNGDFSGASFVFEGIADLEDSTETWFPIDGIKMSGYECGNNFTNKGLYVVPIEGVQKFRVRLTRIGSGNITIFGRVIKF